MKRKIRDIVFGNSEGDIALGHALEGCLTDMILEIPEDERETREVDIVLTIDGKEIDHELFFKHLSDNYFKYLKNVARELYTKEAKDALTDLINAAQTAQTKIESIDENISWDIEVLKRNLNN